MFSLHPQLAADCHILQESDSAVLLLHRNAILPWFILVPIGKFRDFDELSRLQRERTMDVVDRISRYLKSELACDKVNIAALGNQVPQLHIHVIGRFVDDPCWPNPVWGNLKESSTWAVEEIDRLRSATFF